MLLDELGITSGADIRIDAASTVDASTTNFTVTVSNPGAIPATDIVVTNLFPEGLALVGTNHTANVQNWQTFGRTNVFLVKSLARNASEVIRFDCLGTAGTYTNWAEAWPSEGDHTPSNNTAQAELTIAPQEGESELLLTKTVVTGLEAGHAWTVRGTNLTYAIAVTNSGDAATDAGWAIALTDTLPAGVTLEGGGVTNWIVPVLNPGDVWVTNLTVAVDALAPDSLTNRCTLFFGSSVTNAECVTPVRPEADLALTLSPSTNRVGLVRAYQYDVTVTNAGPNGATGVTVLLGGVPAGLTLTPGAGDLGPFDLAAGAVRRFSVPASALQSLKGVVTNQADCVSSVVHDPEQANNTAKAVVLFEPISDVTVDVRWVAINPPGNLPAHLVISAHNNGPQPAPDVQMEVTLPGPVTTNLFVGTLAYGDTSPNFFWVLPAVGATSLTARATVSTPGLESDLTNNEDVDTTGLSWPDVSVTLTDTPDPVASEGALRYTLRVTAAGGLGLVTGIVTDLTLPPEVVSRVVSNGGGTAIPGGLRFGPVSLVDGANSNWVIDVQAPLALTQTVIHATATATAPAGDTNLVNNTTSADTTVSRRPPADLATAVSWQPTGPLAGATNTSYQVKVDVTNLSAAVATNVTLSVWLDTAPALLAPPIGWVAEGALTARLAQAVALLPASGSTSVTFNVTLTDVTPSLLARARVASDNDENPANNESMAPLELTWPDASVELVSVPVSVTSGGEYEYVLTVRATGAAVSGLTADLDLPGSVGTGGVVNASGGAFLPDGLRFGPFDLAKDGQSNWTVRVKAPTVTTNQVLTASASIVPPLGDTDALNDMDTVTTEVTWATADLHASVFWQPAGPLDGGANTDYLFYASASNLSATAAATNVMLAVWLDVAPALLTPPVDWAADGVLTARLAQVIGSLPPGAATGAWFSVRLTGLASNLTARAHVDSLNDDNPVNDDAQASLDLVWPDASVDLASVPASVMSGGEFEYVLTVAASGAAVSGLTADLVLPATVAATNVLNAGGGAAISGGLRFGPVDLAKDAQSNWTVRVKSPTVATNTVLIATASIVPPLGDTSAANNTNDAVTVVTWSNADVQASVFWQPAGPLDGCTNTDYLFYAAASNLSASATASNVMLTVWLDAAPALLKPPADWASDGALTARLAQVVGSLPAGACTGVWFRVALTGLASNLTAHAHVDSLNDDNPANDDAQASLVLDWPDASVDLTSVPVSVTSGGEYEYGLTVSVSGAAVTGLTADIELPAGLVILDAAGGAAIAGGLRFGPFDLAKDGQSNWIVRVRAPAVTTNAVLNATASIVPPLGDSVPANDRDTVTTAVTWPTADLLASVFWQPAGPLDGGTNTDYLFYASASNLSATAAATNVMLTVWLDVAPALLKPPADWVSDGALTARLTQVVGSLPSGAATGVWFRVALAGVANTLMARAHVDSLNDDDPANNDAQASLALDWPDASVELVSVPASVESGGAFAYRLTVEVSGAAAQGLTADVDLPTGLVIVDDAGGVARSGGLRFGPFDLASGGQSNWTVGVRAPVTTSNLVLRAVATVTPPPGDAETSNDMDDAETQVTPPPPADVRAYVAWQANPLVGCTNSEYLLYAAVTNVSASPATAISLKTWLAPAPAVLTAPEGCQLTGALTSELSQVIGTLPSGAGTGVWFRVRLTGVTSALTAFARATCMLDADAGNNEATAVADVLWPDLRITLQPGVGQATEGREIGYTIGVHNDSDVPVTGVWVTNAYPSFVTVTNSGGGLLANGTNVCFGGIALAARATTSLTVRVYVSSLPGGVTSLVSTAICPRPFGDASPLNNTAQSEVPLFAKDVKGGIKWVFSHNSGTFFAQLVLTNTSSERIESVWFAFNDRFVQNTNQVVTRSALWYSRRAEAPTANHIVTNRYADGCRYVDLTVAVSNALRSAAAGADGVWDPGEVVVIGVSSNTLAEFAAKPNGWSVTNRSERLLEMYDIDGVNPALFVDLSTALGSRAGSFTVDGGFDSNQDFIIDEAEIAFAGTAWLAGTLSSSDYVFLLAAYRGSGYRWDIELRQWVVIE